MNCTGRSFYYITIATKSVVTALPYFNLESKMYNGMELNKELKLL